MISQTPIKPISIRNLSPASTTTRTTVDTQSTRTDRYQPTSLDALQDADLMAQMKALSEFAQGRNKPQDDQSDPHGHTTGGKGLGNDEDTSAWFLGDGKKPLPEGKSAPGSSIKTAGGTINFKPNVVNGRWGDTFYGDRFNNRAGVGFQDPGSFNGGGKGNNGLDWFESGVKGAGGAAAATKVGADMGALPLTAIFGGGGAGASAVATASGGVLAAAGAGYALGTMINEAYKSATGSTLGDDWYDIYESATSTAGPQSGDDETPNPNSDDSGTGTFVVPFGNVKGNIERGVKPQGTAGASNDGRGNADPAAGSWSAHSDQAIAQHDGTGSDRPERERDSSAINYSVALKGNLHTDPQRG